jgi:hypothetical protein
LTGFQDAIANPEPRDDEGNQHAASHDSRFDIGITDRIKQPRQTKADKEKEGNPQAIGRHITAGGLADSLTPTPPE